MKKQDINLIFQDLSMRIPYGVMVHYSTREDEGIVTIGPGNICYVKELSEKGWWKDCKPYLRQMSSMTEKERKEFDKFCVIDSDIFLNSDNPIQGLKNQAKIMGRAVAWLLKNHFDFNELIEKDLAIEVTEENNPYKELIK